MNKKLKLLLSAILLVSTLNAEDTQINFEQDNDGNMNPNIFVPVYWNGNWYSGVGYKSSTSKEIGSLSGFSDSKSGAVSTKSTLTMNVLTRKHDSFSYGFKTDLVKIKNNEFGYIHIPDTDDSMFGNGTDYWIAFDNDVELDIVKPAIYLEYNKKMNDLSLRLSADIFQATTLDVKQNTLFKPLVNNTGTSDSSTKQDTAYTLQLQAYYNTNSFINLGFVYSYDFNPIKYDLAQLAYDGTNYIFEPSTVDTEETTTKYLAKIYFNKKVLGGLNPTIGFGKISVDTKNNGTGKVTTDDESIVSIGFERRF